MIKMLEELDMNMDIVPAELIRMPAESDPIDIGEEGPELSKFRATARILASNDQGSERINLNFHVFAHTESDARQKVTDYIQELNTDAEQEGMDLEIEIKSIFVEPMSGPKFTDPRE